MSYSCWVIKLHQVNSTAPYRRKTLNPCPVKRKVIQPFILAWIEQPDKLFGFRIDGSDIAAFVSIADNTGKSQVIRF